MSDPERTQWRAASTHESVERLTDQVCQLLRALPLQAKACFRLKLALHEALSNAVEHGNKNDPAKHVTVTCFVEPRQVSLAVEDEGEGFDWGTVPDPTEEENLLKEGGRGIFLIRRYADDCRFEDNGRRVVIVKHIP